MKFENLKFDNKSKVIASWILIALGTGMLTLGNGLGGIALGIGIHLRIRHLLLPYSN